MSLDCNPFFCIKLLSQWLCVLKSTHLVRLALSVSFSVSPDPLSPARAWKAVWKLFHLYSEEWKGWGECSSLTRALEAHSAALSLWFCRAAGRVNRTEVGEHRSLAHSSREQGRGDDARSPRDRFAMLCAIPPVGSTSLPRANPVGFGSTSFQVLLKYLT